MIGMGRNEYYELMCAELSEVSGLERKPRLLLHSCCAPCSSSVLELLTKYFEIDVYYYNPNIYPEDEFAKRADEQERFCQEFFEEKNITVIRADFDPQSFYSAVSGAEQSSEGGARCARCFELRLGETARYASEHGYDYFASTLSVSPLKNAEMLNRIGETVAQRYGVRFLHNDFKKNDGYKRSCEISREMNMYRQDWCGCRFSYAERMIKSAKGYIFDLDGTLSDTMTYYETFSPNLVRSFGKIPRDTIRDDVRFMTSEMVSEYIVDEYGIDAAPKEILDKVYKDFETFYGKEARLKDGVVEFLEYAKSMEKKLCIASATTERFIESILKNNGVYDKFEFILSCPDLEMYKDKPDIYYKAACDMGLSKDEVIVFEDAHHAVQTAKRGGLRVVGVYDENAKKFEHIIKSESDLYIYNMKELIFK